MNEGNSSNKEHLSLASQHLRTAIDLLDLVEAPGHIAAHVDLALSELEREIQGRRGSTICKSLEAFEDDLRATLGNNRAV